MIINKILIEDKIKEKILYKHGVTSTEIKEALLRSPLFLKTRQNRYLALGYAQKYISIIFELQKDIAFIITARPATDAERKLYKDKRK